jgi:hypothetical protein
MKIRLLLPALIVAGAVAAHAEVIFSSDGTATPDDTRGFTGSNGLSYHADQFTLGSGDGGVLSELVAGGFSLLGNAFTESFYLFTDNSNTIGTLIDTLNVSVPSGDGTTPQLLTASSTGNPALVDGGTYWLEAGPTNDPGNFFEWTFGADSGTDPNWYSSATGYFPNVLPYNTFALLSAPADTPEPSTSWLLLGALSVVPLFRRARCRH